VRAVARALLLIFGLRMVMFLLLTAAVAFWREAALRDVVAFFGTIVATMGTALGGVITCYFGRR